MHYTSFLRLFPLPLTTLLLLLYLQLQLSRSLLQQLITRLIPPRLHLRSLPTSMLLRQNIHPAEINLTELALTCGDWCEFLFAFVAFVLFGSAFVELLHYLLYVLFGLFLFLLLFFAFFLFLFLALGLLLNDLSWLLDLLYFLSCFYFLLFLLWGLLIGKHLHMVSFSIVIMYRTRLFIFGSLLHLSFLLQSSPLLLLIFFKF